MSTQTKKTRKTKTTRPIRTKLTPSESSLRSYHRRNLTAALVKLSNEELGDSLMAHVLTALNDGDREAMIQAILELRLPRHQYVKGS